MIIEVHARRDEFKAFTNFLKGIGISYKYHHRETPETTTLFSIEPSHMDLVSLGLIKDYVEMEKLDIKFIVNGEKYEVSRDYKDLKKHITRLEEREKLTRGYHP